jgi:hypothetical protein
MARYRKVDVRIHGDARVRRLSPVPPCGQGLWWYLLTGPETSNIPGLYRAGPGQLADGLGWSTEAMLDAFGEVIREGLAKADWKARLIWIPKAIKYDPPQSVNVVKAWAPTWDELPECELKTEAWCVLEGYLQGMSEGFREAFRHACPKPSGIPEPEPEPERSRGPNVGTPAAVPPGAKPEVVLGLWREIAEPVGCERVRDFTEKRKAWARAALKARAVEGEGGWLEVLQRVAASPFCRGEVPPRTGHSKPFRASFDWLFGSRDTATHVLEGRYDDGQAKPRAAEDEGYYPLTTRSP